MSTSDVLRLEEYRGRREKRLHRTLTLHGGSPVRSLVLACFADIARTLRADRVVAAWIDEYGAARAHPFAVLDLASDSPRRHVDGDLLMRSWRAGVPGVVCEAPGSPGAPGDAESGGSPWAVSLGSDGVRLWFILVEPAAGTPSLGSATRDTLMFLSGECGAILLHQDLAFPSVTDPGIQVMSPYSEPPERPASTARDALVDLAYFVLDEALVPEPGPLEYRLELAAEALPELEDRAGPAAVVEAARRADADALADALLRTAVTWEGRGLYGEADELFELAYEAACHAGACDKGGRAARGRARALRRSACWNQSMAWYGVAREIARAVGDMAEEAVVLDGVASLHLGRGRVAAARTVLEEARILAETSADPDALASVRFGLMTVAHTEGRLDEAASHGWEAFRGFRSRAARLRALTALGGVFLVGRRLDAAEDAFTVVERETRESYYRLHALAGLARIHAARGDRARYEAALRRLDEAELAHGAPELRAEAYLERGDGYRELGDRDEAHRWYREAVRVADAHRVSEYLIRAEQALDELEREAAGGLREGRGPTEGWPAEEAPEESSLLPTGEASDGRGGRVEAIRRDLGALRRGGAEVGGR